MRAVRFYGSGIGVKMDEMEEPPLERDNEVVVKIAATGLCKTDLHILDGHFDSMIRRIPFVMGHESSGWVHSIREEVGRVKIGEPVLVYPQITCGLCRACRLGDDMRCETGSFHGVDGTDGGFANYMKTNIRNIIPLGRNVDLASCAPLADAGITAYHAVKKVIMNSRTLNYILVIGAGGVGQIAIQLIKRLSSATILVVEASEEKLRIAERLGADYVFKFGEGGSTLEDIRRIAAEGVDASLDFVGEDETVYLSLRSIKPAGVCSIIGYGGWLRVPTMQLVATEATIFGNLVGTYSELRELVDMYLKNKLEINVKPYPLQNFHDALNDLRRGRIMGRAVLVPSAYS